jgi:hypothetical protein
MSSTRLAPKKKKSFFNRFLQNRRRRQQSQLDPIAQESNIAMIRRVATQGWRFVPPTAKVGQMLGTTIFNANKLAGLILNIPFGLASSLGVALAVVFGYGTIVTQWWIRARGMYRRTAPVTPAAMAMAAIARNPTMTGSEAKVETARVEILQQLIAPPTTNAPSQLNPYRNATFFSPGVEVGYLARGGYIVLQGFSVVYMFNTIPSAFLSAYSIAQLIARIPGLSFDSFCADNDATSPSWKLALVNGTAILFAYCSNVAYDVYNKPQIRNYYGKLIIEGEIIKIGGRAWAETLLGVSINTMVLAFTGRASWNLLKDELFCHIGITSIPAAFVSFMVLESCITNYIINGIMTLMAVHNRYNNVHATSRASLLEDIGFSRTLHANILFAIYIDAVANAVGSYVAGARFPETADPSLANEGIPYLWYVMFIACCVALLGFSNTRSLSEEADIRELGVMKAAQEVEAAMTRARADDEKESIALDNMNDEEKIQPVSVGYIPPAMREASESPLVNPPLLNPPPPVAVSDIEITELTTATPRTPRTPRSTLQMIGTFFYGSRPDLTHNPVLVTEDYIARLEEENNRLGVAFPSGFF